MAKSSANIQKMNTGAFAHNDRSGKNPDYIIGSDDGQKNEFDRPAAAAKKLANNFYAEAVLQKENKRVASKKNSMSEVVVNLNRHHTLDDVEQLAKAFENEFGFTTVQIAVHKDEGHINDRGIKKYNNHAHICFFTLDKTTGKQLHNLGNKFDRNGKIYAHKTDTTKMQDITSRVLRMERGKWGSKAQRLSAKQFRFKAKEVAEISLELDDLKRDYMQAREDLKASKTADLSDYVELKKGYQELKTEIENPKPKTPAKAKGKNAQALAERRAKTNQREGLSRPRM